MRKHSIRGSPGGSSSRDAVILEYSSLADGESVRGELCPACRGGESEEGSLSVTRTDGVLLWNCYRASCGFKGAHGLRRKGVHGGGSSLRVPTKAQSRGTAGRILIRESEHLPDYVKETLAHQYSLTESHLARAGTGWSASQSRVVVPVFGRDKSEQGCILRAVGDATPKSISFVDEGAMAWYASKEGPDVLVIVEDQFSAIRASDYVDSVALLGTNLNEARVAEIAEQGYNRVYLALDKDAFSLAVNYIVQWRSKLPLLLLRLDKDIKNHTPEELDELMKEVER